MFYIYIFFFVVAILNFKLFILYWGIADFNSVVVVSGEQQKDSAIHIHIHSLLNPVPIQAGI